MPMGEALNAMERDEALSLLKAGRIDEWNHWNQRRANGEEIPDFFRANLTGADLHGANLSKA